MRFAMHRHLKQGFSWIAVLLLPFLCAVTEAAESGWQKIPPQDLARMVAEGGKPFLINTMGEIECLDHSIAGSLCIPAEEFEKRISELPPRKDRMLVLYCESDAAQKSCEAADLAIRNGYTAVRVLDGGMQAWKGAGYATVAVERIPRRAISSLKPPVLRKRLAEKKNILLVDIRSEGAFQSGHIGGAVNLPMYQLHRRYRELPINRPLILVDNRGFRSPLAASYLAAKGYAVERLFGGMASWRAMLAKEKNNAKRQ
jgi:rhodanese-related sulfurtransferase